MPAPRPAKVDWKVSIIPKDAANATDPVMADPSELEAVIANPGSLQLPQPIQAARESVVAAPRYNANVPYMPEPTIYSMQDQELMKLIRKAVTNGWQNYHRFASDAVSIGLEAEAVITGMRKQRMSPLDLMKDESFIKALNG